MRPVASAFTQVAVVVDLISTIPIGSVMLIHWLLKQQAWVRVPPKAYKFQMHIIDV